MGTSTLSSIAELKMHVRNEHQLNLTKTRMKRMFKTRSQSTPSDGLSTVAQPPSPQLVPPTADEATPLPVNEDPI